MICVIQRVKKATVTVGHRRVGHIAAGGLIFLGVARDDREEDADFLARKIAELRMFEDAGGKMNLAGAEVGAAFLVVSQFTLLADCQKGRRPSFDAAADPAPAEALYNLFVEKLRARHLPVETGEFRAMMEVELVNDGPVTFIINSIDSRA